MIARAVVTTTVVPAPAGGACCWCCGKPGRVTIQGVLVHRWHCADCLGIGEVTWMSP